MRAILLILIGFSLSFARVVVDDKTGLMWQDDNAVKSVKKSWYGAKSYCEELRMDGYDDWTLPTRAQLLSITDKTEYKPAIKDGFSNVASASSNYWSSSSDVSNSTYAWYVYFNYGYSSSNYKTDERYVRCVRAGQSDTLTFDETFQKKEFDGKVKPISFEDLVNWYVEKELQNIPKPPKEIKLVKDEFETTAEFQARVAKTKKTQKKLVASYKKKYKNAKQNAKKRAIKKALQYTWGKPILSNLHYDADDSIFIADVTFEHKKDFSKKVAIKVKRKNARAVKKAFATLKPQAVFDYDGNSVKLKKLRVPYKKKLYAVYFTDYNMNDTAMAVNLKNDYDVGTNIHTSISVADAQVDRFNASKLRDFGELDRLLKSSLAVAKNRHKWLFVIGIEKYEYTDNINYARRSAEMFVKVAQKKLGVPKQNTFLLLDEKATQADIKNRFKKFLRRVKKGDTIYFYYNGHGVPVPSLKNEPFMLASNSEPDFIADEKFFSLQNIYSSLSKSKAKKVIAFVDSCFSGVTDGKGVLKGVAATKMVAKQVKFDKDKMVVLMAGKKRQYSNGYDKKGYRLFSYFVMKNIIEGDREIKNLYRDVKSQTYDASLEEWGDVRTQEPTIDGNYRMSL